MDRPDYENTPDTWELLLKTGEPKTLPAPSTAGPSRKHTTLAASTTVLGATRPSGNVNGFGPVPPETAKLTMTSMTPIASKRRNMGDLPRMMFFHRQASYRRLR